MTKGIRNWMSLTARGRAVTAHVDPGLESFIVPKSPEGWVFTIISVGKPYTYARLADAEAVASEFLPIFYGPAEVQKAANQ